MRPIAGDGPSPHRRDRVGRSAVLPRPVAGVDSRGSSLVLRWIPIEESITATRRRRRRRATARRRRRGVGARAPVDTAAGRDFLRGANGASGRPRLATSAVARRVRCGGRGSRCGRVRVDRDRLNGGFLECCVNARGAGGDPAGSQPSGRRFGRGAGRSGGWLPTRDGGIRLRGWRGRGHDGSEVELECAQRGGVCAVRHRRPRASTAGNTESQRVVCTGPDERPTRGSARVARASRTAAPGHARAHTRRLRRPALERR